LIEYGSFARSKRFSSAFRRAMEYVEVPTVRVPWLWKLFMGVLGKPGILRIGAEA
jgi:hypothetical protein